jgi:tau tubulin kinase
VLIDFGLARKYVNEDGSHMAARSDASFRGSTAYASVHAHRNEDLSRRDDLWSWFYMLLELVEGKQGGEGEGKPPVQVCVGHWAQA